MCSQQMERLQFENKYEDNNDNISCTWYLVRWIGSFPEVAFDIIKSSDVILNDSENKENLTIGSTIMVRCGKIKSPAHILQISDNTDILYHELRQLQRKVGATQNNTINKYKKRKTSSTNNEIKVIKLFQDATTQTDENISKLIEENGKLKAELYEANRLMNSMCKDLSAMVQNTQRKILNLECNDDPISTFIHETPKNSLKETNSNKLNTSACSLIEQKDNILIGNNRTPIPRYIFNSINWHSFTHATRKLLMAVFSRNILATHSLSGKPSPAFMSSDMPIKMKLDSKKVADIVEIVSLKCNVTESMVRGAITTKCADENKMFKKRSEKKSKEES